VYIILYGRFCTPPVYTEKKNPTEVRPETKLHGRLTRRAYSNSDPSYTYILCTNVRENLQTTFRGRNALYIVRTALQIRVCVSHVTPRILKRRSYNTRYIYISQVAAEYREKCEASEKLQRCVKLAQWTSTIFPGRITPLEKIKNPFRPILLLSHWRV